MKEEGLQLWSVERAADELYVSTATMRKWVRDGLIPSVWIGKQHLIQKICCDLSRSARG